MKKTYKTNNGENRSSFFRVGRKLVSVRFLPTFTTENPMVQDAIEKSAVFREGIQLVTPSMEWINIDRDENGFATIETLNVIVELHKDGVPIAMRCGDTYEILSPDHDIYGWYGEIERDTDYTHYLLIPKLEV